MYSIKFVETESLTANVTELVILCLLIKYSLKNHCSCSRNITNSAVKWMDTQCIPSTRNYGGPYIDELLIENSLLLRYTHVY